MDDLSLEQHDSSPVPVSTLEPQIVPPRVWAMLCLD
jgi:hypothetical protein